MRTCHLVSFVVLPLMYASIFLCLELATAGLQWLKHLWNHEYMFETGVVVIIAPNQETE